jgi:hypothetical protein
LLPFFSLFHDDFLLSGLKTGAALALLNVTAWNFADFSAHLEKWFLRPKLVHYIREA